MFLSTNSLFINKNIIKSLFIKVICYVKNYFMTRVQIQRIVLSPKNDQNTNGDNILNSPNKINNEDEQFIENDDDNQSTQDIDSDEQAQEEPKQEMKLWEFLWYLILWPWTKIKKVYNSICPLFSSFYDGIISRINNFFKGIDWRIAILLLTGICCLGFVLDVVRQHMHPEKFNDNNLLNL